MNKKTTGLLFLVFLTTLAYSQGSLSATERKVLASVDRQMPQTIALLKESVDINSGTFNIEGVKKVGAIYRRQLEALGFTTEWVAMPGSMGRAGHLVAWRKGTKGKKLLLIGHLDTVFEPSMPAGPFTILNDSTASGQGVNDMKGGDVMIIAALKALDENNLLKDASITVYFTGDEENAGDPKEVSRGDFIRRGKASDVALAFETATNMNTVATARRGSSTWELKVESKQAHSSGLFGSAGFGSVYEAARIINTFREQLQEPYLTFNPGLFAGGSNVEGHEGKFEVQGKSNIIAPKAIVAGDLRFLSEQQKQTARRKMRAIVDSSLRGTKASITFMDGIPSMPPTGGNQALADKLNKLSLEMGLGIVQAGNPGSRGAGDISYTAEFTDCLDGLGASGTGAHAPGETINLKQFPSLIKRTALFINRLIND
ncbi:MAG: M20/M25/M40 family metallo-hydrolase [Candidatus Dadabacteria bacterium]